MSTVPKITDEHWQAADKATGGYNYVEMCNKAIEIALAEQQESEYITAAQARELGAGNAEWLNPFTKEWRICVKDLRYLETMSNDGKNVIKYRAIKQAQPVSWNTKYIDSTPKLSVGNSAFEDWFQAQEFATLAGVKQMCRDSYAAGMGDPLVTYATTQAQPEPVDEQLYCMVSKDGKPDIRMLRTEAQELQRNLGDTVDWFMPEPNKVGAGLKIAFTLQGTYTYRTKATIKLDGKMVTPEQAAAEWRAKKETHEFWYKHSKKPNFYIPDGRDFIAYALVGSEYELRPKPAKVAVWTGSRDDVIALLKENGLI